MKRRFLFHWIIMVVVETARGVTIRVRFLPLILTSLGSKSGTLFVPESGKTCQHYFGGFQTRDFSRYADRPEIPNQALTALTVVLRRPQSIGRDKPLRAADASIQGVMRCPQRADKTNNGCGWLIATALAEAWDEASLSAQISA